MLRHLKDTIQFSPDVTRLWNQTQVTTLETPSLHKSTLYRFPFLTPSSSVLSPSLLGQSLWEIPSFLQLSSNSCVTVLSRALGLYLNWPLVTSV